MSEAKTKRIDLTPTPSEKPEISHEEIALRAYAKWEERGCLQGDEENDWLEARAELEEAALARSLPTPRGDTLNARARQSA